RTDSNQWERGLFSGVPAPGSSNAHPNSKCAQGKATDCGWAVVLPHIRVDDWVFGVSSVGKDGFESPVASAVPGGAFHPYIAREKK
ncbi:MAG TPA: hypothetical protein VIV07_00340, partial [Sphingomicrobium sp.]